MGADTNNYAVSHSDDNNPAEDVVNPSKLSSNVPQLNPTYQPTPMRNISTFTAASETDLHHNPNSFYINDNINPQECDDQNRLAYYLRQVKTYSLFGSVFLLLMAITFLVLRHWFPAIAVLILVVALSLCAVYGVQKKDWRLILGVFILSFTLLAYLAARGVLSIVLCIARSYLSDEELNALGFSSRGLMITSGIVEFFLCLFLAIYFGVNGFYSEKIVRILLDSAQYYNNQQHPRPSPNYLGEQPGVNGGVRVVGNPVYFSAAESPTHSAINIIEVHPTPPNGRAVSAAALKPDSSTQQLPVVQSGTSPRHQGRQTIGLEGDPSHDLTFDRLPPPSSSNQ